MSISFETPRQIVAAYENGLPGWQFHPETMDTMMADRKVAMFAEVALHLSGIGKGKMALLWRSREEFDPGAFGKEAQTRGSCVSHGSRNARDTTRAVEIHIKGEAEEYYKRGATEPTYAARGHYGEGIAKGNELADRGKAILDAAEADGKIMLSVHLPKVLKSAGGAETCPGGVCPYRPAETPKPKSSVTTRRETVRHTETVIEHRPRLLGRLRR